MKIHVSQPNPYGVKGAKQKLLAGDALPSFSFVTFTTRTYDDLTNTAHFALTIYGPFRQTQVVGQLVIGADVVTFDTDNIDNFTPLVFAAQEYIAHQLAAILK